MYSRTPYLLAMVIERTRKLTIRISNDELETLGRLADAKGVSGSDWVRVAIREAGEKLPKKASRK